MKQTSFFTLIELLIVTPYRKLRSSFSRSTSAISSTQSFTLIELLIVIGILAILTAAVVIILNPGELLKEARDSSRMTDMASISKTVQLLLTQNPSLNLGTASTVYISIPDTSATCANITSLPTLPSGYSYHCVTSANSTNINGTGWLPIDFTAQGIQNLSALPLDPTNAVSTSTPLFYAYVANPTAGTFTAYAASLESNKYQPSAAQDGGVSSIAYEKGSNAALMPPAFPYGSWVKVPGNGTFGTPDFWAMKYDAKCLSLAGVPYNTVGASYDTGYHTYYDSTYPCTAANSKFIASTAQGFPIAYVSHTTALSYCTAIGAHLLTNDEYMTIATNAANQGSNWSSGSVGSGYLYSGHNDNAPGYALEAGDDTNGYYGDTNIGGNQKRTLTLSNGSVIWDMAGNVWEHVQRSTNNVGDNTASMALPTRSDGGASWNWGEYGGAGTVNNANYINNWSADVVQANVAPPNSSWNSTNGMGQVYTYGTGVNQGTSVFIRGAGWNSGSGAGAFALNVGWGAGSTSGTVGFRCAR